ncbi:hypothetical protein [Bradyrhizobium frederickii]|nr:hypothetical protein [Bradyrhizobium frederickii]
MDIRSSTVMHANKSLTTIPSSKPSRFEVYVAQLSIILVLMQSTLVAGVPFSFTATPMVFAIGAISGGAREHRLMFWSAAAGMAFVLYALLVDVQFGAALKSGVGFVAFFVSLIYFPVLLRRMTPHTSLHFWLPQVLVVLFFILEFSQILSLKELGVVSWRLSAEQQMSTKLFFDNRPSGMFGEPSWLGLSLAALFRLSIVKRQFVVPSALIVGAVIFLSGSSLGLIAWACTLVPAFKAVSAVRDSEIRSGGTRNHSEFVGPILAVVASSVLLTAVLYYAGSDMSLAILEKISDPLGNASGVSRYMAPVYFLGETLSDSPLFGMGMHYIPDFLIGRTGAAVLPFNVLIELGMVGLLFYFLVGFAQVRYYKPSVFDLMLCLVILGGLGLQYTAFQGALVSLPIVASYLERVQASQANGTLA